ncbi:MAG: aryl-sulfate sulfotransferase, partial [Ignavibacteriaceae bacterium]|nr:aryl-sulfate sulfotransferase [Ignavibacteriaceae bacterium]
NVTGSISGLHSGKILISDDDKTILFNPYNKFSPAEEVTVTLSAGLRTISGNNLIPISFNFFITTLENPIRPTDSDDENTIDFSYKSNKSSNFNPDSIPEDFPEFIITVTGETAPGLLFGGNRSSLDTVGSYDMIIDNNGVPVYYEPYAGNLFRLQDNGLISYAKALPNGGKHDYIYMIMDSSYAIVDSFQMGNGYIADNHDFVLLPNGHALMEAYDVQIIDMSQIIPGGHPAAQVTGSIIQELDLEKNVVFQWRCWDHIPITDSYRDITKAKFDYIHINSMELDLDGHIIASFRELWEITKISRVTGEIIWRLGGRHEEFTYVNEHPENAPHYFKLQHCVRRLNNGNLTIFDNGADGNNPERPYSRAVEYEMDEVNKVVTLVWEYRHDPDIVALNGGTMQRLSNGNSLINWGSAIAEGAPAITEVKSDGTTAFELSYSGPGIGGGFMRFPWKNSGEYATVKYYEVVEGNEYIFNSGDSIITGTTIDIDSLTGDIYNSITVTRVTHGPVNPEFNQRAPRLLTSRVAVSRYNIISIVGTIYFDKDVFDIYNSDSVIIYHRETEGSGIFNPLPTTYNPVTKQISTTITKFGEFIFGYPDYNNVAYAPLLLSPGDSTSVNQTLPVKLIWTPIGYTNSFQLQVADNPQFNNPIIDEQNLLNAAYIIDTVEYASNYYWRVKSFNQVGASEWSPTFMFNTIAPYITVTFPNGGEQFQVGLKYFIHWDDNVEENIIVELFKNDLLLNIIDTTSNIGVYQWNINPNLPLGSDYKIFIRSSVTDTLFDLSDDYFALIDTVTGFNSDGLLPGEFKMSQNYPNPFNSLTRIKFQLPNRALVTLKIFDILGDEVADLINIEMEQGTYEITFDAAELSSGIYFYRLKAGSFVNTRKMILLK